MKKLLRNRRFMIRLILIVTIIGGVWLALSLRESTGNEDFIFRQFASNLTDPTFLVDVGDGRFFVSERVGRVSIIGEDQEVLDTPFLDITELVESSYIEQGLLGLALSPNYAEDGYFYVNYTHKDGGQTTVARYSVSNEDPNRADPVSAKIILQVAQPRNLHNGGFLLFGPDGYLCIGLGDGGDRSSSQNTNSLLGSILRIDVSGELPYTIPEDNPFVGDDGIRDEIWAYGLRNPWRFSFDRLTQELYIGDVGEDQREEINYRPFSEAGGENYGWPIFEGTFQLAGDSTSNPDDYVMPIFEYEHNRSGIGGIDARVWQCSVTGGYVYRGQMMPELQGYYIFGDWCAGTLFTLIQENGEWISERFMDTPFRVNSFAEDLEGEIYLLDASGVWKLFPR